MNIFIAIIITFVFLNNTTANDWLFDSNQFKNIFSDPTENMRLFFNEQKDKIENAFKSSYDEVVQVTATVETLIEEQQKKITTNIEEYVGKVQTESQRVIDKWSFLPIEDSEPKIENPDLFLSVPAIIKRHGYHCETHVIISQGYVLNIHRIRKYATVSPKTVLLQHGLFASSADWIINGPEKSLAYVLVDAGYDVWMTNIRGNRYSKEHLWLKTDSQAYWNFSWHDVALYDIPAVIDYIMKLKEDAKLVYIGHSMGTTILFAMLSLRPEYNEILSGGIALAPEVFVSNMNSPLKSMAPILSKIAYMEMLYGSYEFIPKHSALGQVTGSCNSDNVDSFVCKNIIFYICGYDDELFNKTILPVFLSHLGTGTSWKTAVHFAQEILSSKFQHFDYGADNLRMYGSEYPPEYDLDNVKLPIKLFWSKNDLLSNEKDVRILHEKVPSTEMYLIEHSEFNHLDYLLATEAPRLVNEKVLNYLNKMYQKTAWNSLFDTFHSVSNYK